MEGKAPGCCGGRCSIRVTRRGMAERETRAVVGRKRREGEGGQARMPTANAGDRASSSVKRASSQAGAASPMEESITTTMR